jgi:hypothetical protein
MERIFRAMVTGEDQKVRLATHMLAEEAEYWWTKKYFPEDLRTKRTVQ